MIRIVGKDKIYVTISFSKEFTTTIETLKKYHCRYSPDTKEWIVPISNYALLLEELQELDIIDIINPTDIEMLLCPPTQIVLNRITYDESELKYKQIEGKHPYENYQYEDLQRTLNRNRFALFLDVGTGKSYIILSAIHLLFKRNLAKKVLYITSNSGVYDTKEKFEQFTNIDKNKIVVGNKHNRRPFDSNADVIICNYRSFLLISDEYQKDRDKGKRITKAYRSTPIPIDNWLDSKVGIIVLDESHNISTHSSRQTNVINLIKEKFYYRYLLTGTPADTEEKYYSQLRFLDEYLVKGYNYNEWCSYYGNVGTKYSQYVLDSFKPEKLPELQAIVKNNCARRLASDVLVLPPNHEHTLYIDMDKNHRELYEELTKYYLRKLKQQKGYLSTPEVIRSFPTLMMSIDNPTHIDITKIDDPILVNKIMKFKFKNHTKIEPLLDILQEYEGRKIVIWTSHPSVGEELAKILEKKLPYIINGETKIPSKMTKDEYKTNLVKEFERNPNRHIMIAGIQVLNTAITMTKATVQIYFDTNFNYTEVEQSEARIYRISQNSEVNTYKLICKDSLDVTRYKMMMNKDFINDKFLTKEYLDQKTLETVFGGLL